MSFDFSIPPTGSQPASSPSSPSSLQRSRSPDSSSRQPQIDPDLLADELSALFVDALANQFGFGDTEQDLRKNLHGFAKVHQEFNFFHRRKSH